MLSLKDCRTILGTDCDVSDADLEALRDQLYGLADFVIASFSLIERTGTSEMGGKPNQVRGRNPRSQDQFPPLYFVEDRRIELEERAAILEFDGGMTRQDAEAMALSEYVRRRAN
jgi:hypothetical protein